MKTTVVTCRPTGRVVALSDIHGCLPLLQKGLAAVAYSAADTLVIVGDLVDRGRQSLETLRYVMALAKAGPVYAVMGNRDALLLEGLLEGKGPYGHTLAQFARSYPEQMALSQMCREIGMPYDALEDLDTALPKLRAHFADEITFLQQMPTVVLMERYLFVHAGLPSADLDAVARGDAFACMKNDNYRAHPCPTGHWQVVGHWPATLYRDRIPLADPLIDNEHRIVSIDGGCGLKNDAQLNLMLIPDVSKDDFTFMPCEELPTVISDCAQVPSADSIHVCWGNDLVERVGEPDGDCTLCRHLGSGRTLWIPNDCLWEWGGALHSSDMTDYRLPVQPGEPIALVRSTSKGHLCKKNGVTGWVERIR